MYGRDPDRCVIIQRAVAGRAPGLAGLEPCSVRVRSRAQWVFSPEFTVHWMHVALKTRFALFLSLSISITLSSTIKGITVLIYIA